MLIIIQYFINLVINKIKIKIIIIKEEKIENINKL